MKKAHVYAMSEQQIEAHERVSKDFRPMISEILAGMTAKFVKEVGLPQPVAVAAVSTVLIEHILRLYLVTSGIKIKKPMLADIEDVMHSVQRTVSEEVYDLIRKVNDDKARMN